MAAVASARPDETGGLDLSSREKEGGCRMGNHLWYLSTHML